MAGLPSLRNQLLALAIILIVVLAAGALIAPYTPPAVDWNTAFRPAALAVLNGRSPYEVEGFFNAPWATLPLIPLAVLPESIGRVYLAMVAITAFGYVAHRLGGSKVAVIAVLVSPMVLHEVLNGNIDWLVVLGLVLPPWLGLFFLAIKPQISVGIILFWAYSAWKEGSWQRLLRTFAPVTAVFAISLLAFGFWPLRSAREIDLWWNASLWPVSIPVGLALLVAAIRKNDLRYSMGASPCLSPYVLFHSWIIALLAIIRSTPETLAAVTGLWVLVIIRQFGG
jgi:hypothetical protein